MERQTKTKIVRYIIAGFIVFFLISIFYVVAFSINLEALSLSSLLYSIGRLSGLFGFLFLSLLIISGDTARFFDRFFGMDRIIKFQRKFALITALFVLSHPVFFILSNGSYLSYMIPDFVSIPFALGTFAFYIFIIVIVSSALYKRISYKIWQYIHILIYILFFFGLYHAINAGSDSGSFLIRTMYGMLFVSLIIGIIFRTNYKLKQRKNKFYVEDVKWETKDTFTLIVEPQQKFSFKPGQFCFLRLNKHKLYARHPFTISSSPNEDTLEFTMKNTGRFTQTASQLKKGEEVIVDGPFGVFIIENEKKNLVFIAGGVGITPFMSMIKEHTHNNKKQNILLLYGSRTREDIIFKDELDKIKEEWFRKIYVLSNCDSVEMYEKGYINKTMIEKYVKYPKNAIFFICGPETMKDCVKKALIDLGVRKRNIMIEDFF